MHKCLRIHTNQDFFQYCTLLEANLSKSGKNKVNHDLFSPQWSHQKTHWPRYSIIRLGNNGHQCHHRFHYLPSKWKINSRDQTTLSRHDHQERTCFIIQLKKYFTFEVQVLDDKNVRRRFRASNYQSTTRVKPFICTMPMRLDEGWNQIQFNLSDFTRRAYGSNYIETLRVTIHANCRIRRIYFSDRLYSEEELPPEFKLFLPIQKQQW